MSESTARTDAVAPPANALGGERSPYLRQHMHNPVDWRPWGEAAFAEARQRDVPIFLSIGYATCYWCHVMERQVFENAQLAAHINERLVCIKVDREERPDVDNLYMTATQLLTQGGGWPMSVFLTPPPPEAETGPLQTHAGYGLKPFWAGTYIPPTRQHGRPGFAEVIDALAGFWDDQRGQVLEQAQRIAQAVEGQVGGTENHGPVGIASIQQAAGGLLQRYDSDHGGFSGNQGPKFPTPNHIQFLLTVFRNNADASIGRALAHTLERMARGGMYDQVGGGFHRYSVDEKWLVPHFEKMLYDNGQLLELYAQAMTSGLDETLSSVLCPRILRETAAYLQREMRDAGGAFWSAQDAEVHTMEGGNYVWNEAQVREALADQPDAPRLTEFALKLYGLDRGTNFQDPHHPEAPPMNVLHLPEPLEAMTGMTDGDADEAAELRRRVNAALLAVRDRRDQPSTDDKVLAAWNAMAVAGLARAGKALGDAAMIDAAGRAMDAVLNQMSVPDGGLHRSMREGSAHIPAFLEDYAFVIHGLIELHRATADDDRRRLDEALRLVRHVHEHFADSSGGFYDTLPDQADLFVRSRSSYDGALPTGNSQMMHNLLDLHGLTGERIHIERVVAALRSFSGVMTQTPLGAIHMQHALLRVLESAPADLIEALGRPGDEAAGPPREAGVEARLTPLTKTPDAWRLTLAIPQGMHLNANPASDETLTATAVTAEPEDVDVEVDYPPGVERTYPRADGPLRVYEGRVEITLRPAGRIDAVRVRYQACTDAACLAPAEVRVAVEG